MQKTVPVLLALAVCVLVLGAAGCQSLTPGASAATSTTSEMTTASAVTAYTPVPTTVVKTGPPAVWNKLTPAGEPKGRRGHTLVYDPRVDRVLMFGGSEVSGGNLSDLWAYDPGSDTWTQLHPTGNAPGARSGHTMVYDPATGRDLLFGGHTVSGYGSEVNDLWAYDSVANSWALLHPSGFPPPYQGGQDSVMVHDPDSGKMLLFSGDGLWKYDPVTNSWTALHPTGDVPIALFGHMVVYDSAMHKFVLFGGLRWDDVTTPEEGSYEKETYPTEVWTYDSAADSWARAKKSGASPYGRIGHALVYHPGSGLVILFGGNSYRDTGPDSTEDGSWIYPPDLMSYDVATNTWTELSTKQTPSTRDGLAMAYDSKTGQIVMFGGENFESALIEAPSGTWTLNP